MKKKKSLFIVLMLSPFLAFSQNDEQGGSSRLKALDAYWAEVSRTVNEGDYDGYVATYDSKASYVSDLENKTFPISKAFAGWKQGFIDTKAGKQKSAVEFKFSKRMGDEKASFEIGMFHYYFEQDGQRVDSYIHFEALLIKDGTWKMMMEYQKSSATKEDWDKLKK